ncbi:MAG TPA: hypothetical protein VNM90_06630 [Haliangium sp.]|nr:hypothetical protein [Haliangium sp.]
MDRGNPRGGSPGGPGRPPGGSGGGPGRATGGGGQPPPPPGGSEKAERALARPPSTLTDISAAAVHAALRSQQAQAQAAPARSSAVDAAIQASASPARSSVVDAAIQASAAAAAARREPAPVSEAPPAKSQGVRVKVDAARAATSDDQVSLSREIMLAVGLVLGVLGAALPAVVLGWLVLALVVQTGTSEILERTGGLAPTTFGGGYWLSLGVTAGVLLWCAVRRLRRRPAAWRPLVVLIVGLVIALWALVSIDACGLADVPDVLTTFALLGADALVQYLAPVALLALLGQGALYAWRVGRASVRAARRITAVAGCLGLAGLSAAAMLFLAGAGGPVASLLAQAGDVRVADLGGVEADRRRYERVAATVESTSVRLCR